jgi:hypothetical protein
MIYATPFTFASGRQMLHGALFEKTAPLDPWQKLFINKRDIKEGDRQIV